MKIIKVNSKKVGDTTYHKYILNLPKKLIDDSNFIGKELIGKIENGKLIIEERG